MKTQINKYNFIVETYTKAIDSEDQGILDFLAGRVKAEFALLDEDIKHCIRLSMNDYICDVIFD